MRPRYQILPGLLLCNQTAGRGLPSGEVFRLLVGFEGGGVVIEFVNRELVGILDVPGPLPAMARGFFDGVPGIGFESGDQLGSAAGVAFDQDDDS